jgi:hypothetical protein
MERNQKVLVRAAESIRSQLWRLTSTPKVIPLPEPDWRECQTLVRQLERAAQRGWVYSQAVLRDGLELAITRYSERLQQISTQFSSSRRGIALPTLRSVFGELSALRDEFDACTIDLRNETLSVTTERIVLEEIDLGPFEVRLDWSRIGQRRCYEVIALEPNPARESDDVTHPHVKSDQLCEGDGQHAIEHALRSGRLCDFCQVVNRILNTYNGGSAYAQLSQWDGGVCDDCGQSMSDDDRSYCDRCDQVLCLDCLVMCPGCENPFCHSCTDACRICESSLCAGCQCSCDRCDRVCCANCLSESGHCDQCQEQENEETLDPDEDEPIEAAAAVAPSAGSANPVTKPDATSV